MRIKILLLLGMFCFSINMLGQEVGSVVDGEHSVTLIKSKDKFACVYSDFTCKDLSQKSFNFPIKETVYDIIMKGFSTFSNHQVFVQMDESTIIKFQYKIIENKLMLKINHRDLDKGSVGESVYLTENQVKELFGITTNFG